MTRRCVLVAEDDDAMRGWIADSIRRSGFDVIEVADGASALDVIASSPPDIAIADIRMPCLSGLHVLASLRSVSPAIPTIIMSAFPEPETRATAERLGAVRVIDKPFTLAELHAAIAHCVFRTRRDATDARRLAMRFDEDASDTWDDEPTRPIPLDRIRPIRVLVAEADLALRTLIVDQLLDQGCEVIEATRGDQALAIMHREQLGLAILGVHLPLRSGLDVIHELRASDLTTPVLLITAFPEPGLLAESVRLGVALLAKPFEAPQLTRAIAALTGPYEPADRGA